MPNYTKRAVGDLISDKCRFEVLYPDGWQPYQSLEDSDGLGSGECNEVSKSGKNNFLYGEWQLHIR